MSNPRSEVLLLSELSRRLNGQGRSIRLLLPRLGYEVCVERLSTEAGRRMASRQHSGRGED